MMLLLVLANTETGDTTMDGAVACTFMLMVATADVLSGGFFNAQQPNIYCSNASGNKTECYQGDTFVVNDSEVCTKTNGLCVTSGDGTGGKTVAINGGAAVNEERLAKDGGRLDCTTGKVLR